MEDGLFTFLQKDFPNFVGMLVSVQDVELHGIACEHLGFLGDVTVSLG